MTSSADLASLYQLLARTQPPQLPSGEQRAILGCGYVGEAVASGWQQQGHEVWATSTRAERLAQLEAIVDHPLRFDSTDPGCSLEPICDVDGILICLAPSRSTQASTDHYRQTFVEGVRRLAAALAGRRRSGPLQLVYLSSCGIYGNKRGAITDETASPDLHHPLNGILFEAEREVLALRSASIRVCILRLGGIYGPGRDIAAMLLRAAGTTVRRNGLNHPCWSHIDDIVRGVDFAFEHQLDDVYNLVDDTQCNAQELSDRLCERAGLPCARWLAVDTTDRVLNARVSNAKLKRAGFVLTQPSMLAA